MSIHSSGDSNDGRHKFAADITASVTSQTHELAPTHQPFINPWPAGLRPDDVFALMVPGWNALPARTQLPATRADMTFEATSSKPTRTKGIFPPMTLNMPSSPIAPEKRGLDYPDFVSGSSQEPPDARKEKRVKMMQSENVTSPRSMEDPMECFLAPSLDPAYVSFDSTYRDLENMTQENYLAMPTEGHAPVGEVSTLEQQWRNLWIDSQMHIGCENLDLDWNPSPIRFGESVTSPGSPVGAYCPAQPEDTGITEFGIVEALADNPDRDDDTDHDLEPECEFNLKAIRKTVEDIMKSLRGMQQEESPASKTRQDTAKIIIMRALLEWIPNIHLVAPGIEYNASLKNAHKCLMYAAKIMKLLDEMEGGYGLIDLEYGVNVNLTSGKNKIVKEWKNVANYEPYGILVWIWRDLCLSILNNEVIDGSGGAIVADLLDDIKGSVPLETYDYLKKEEIFSFWDLFLAGGGLVTARKRSNLNGIKIQSPNYWPKSFVKAMESLEHLYCANRLNEFREFPSVDLYQTVKGILPEEYQTKLFEAIKTDCRASKLEAKIDIFVFERTTECLELLLEDKVLERSSKRFRDILVTFSSSKKLEAEWAHKQVLIGFEEEVKAVSEELLRVFPNIHIAFTKLCEEGDIGLEVKRFLELAREGCVDDHRGGNISEVKYRHIFQSYLEIALEWNRRSRNSARTILLREMKNIFLSNLGIILELGGLVGKTLKRGCNIYKAPELKSFLEYVLGDFGFEEILKIEGVVGSKTAKRTPSGASKRSGGRRRNLFTTKRVSRGIAKVKVRVRGVKRPTEISAVKVDVADNFSE